MTLVRKLFHCKDTRTVNICHFLNSCFDDYIIRDLHVMYNVSIFLIVETRNTPNANMENDSVGALEEFNESEANWDWPFVSTKLPQPKSLGSSTIYISLCLRVFTRMPLEWMEIVQRSLLRKNSESMQLVSETKEVSSRSALELKFFATFSGWKILQK